MLLPLLLEARFLVVFFFFNDTATTEIYTLSLHDALPIWQHHQAGIHRAELQRSVDASTEDDGAGAAIALRAAFLGSGEMRAGAKPVEHRHARRGAILAAWRSVQQEAHRTHSRLVPPLGRQPQHARACFFPLEDSRPPRVEKTASCACADSI